MKKLKTFVKKLQRSDDARKRRWYFGTAVVAMSLVIFMWGLYVSAFITDEESAAASIESQAGETGLFRTFGLGWQKMREEALRQFQNRDNTFGGAIGGLAEKAGETNDIVVESPESNFYFAGTEEVPTSSLPMVPRR